MIKVAGKSSLPTIYLWIRYLRHLRPINALKYCKPTNVKITLYKSLLLCRISIKNTTTQIPPRLAQRIKKRTRCESVTNFQRDSPLLVARVSVCNLFLRWYTLLIRCWSPAIQFASQKWRKPNSFVKVSVGREEKIVK